MNFIPPMISDEDRRIVQQSSEDRLKILVKILFSKILKCEKQAKRVPVLIAFNSFTRLKLFDDHQRILNLNRAHCSLLARNHAVFDKVKQSNANC